MSSLSSARRSPAFLNPAPPSPSPPQPSSTRHPFSSSSPFGYTRIPVDEPDVLFDVQLEDTSSSAVRVPPVLDGDRYLPSHLPRLSLDSLSTRPSLPLRSSPALLFSTSSLHIHPPSLQPHNSSFSPSRIFDRLRPWLPFLLWIATSAAFVLAITVWRAELFRELDNLAHYLQEQGSYGYAIMFSCIFITTFPPLPLYSTFIILSGYTFGAWHGFILSYSAALSGAIVVYLLSRQFLRDYLQEVLSNSGWIKCVVRTIERRPKLLFLIRVAPYPYNLLNALLAAAPSLSMERYVVCTALSLFKLIIHTSAGSTIHEFAEYHTSVSGHGEAEEQESSSLTRSWSVIGISLCVGIIIYLSFLARKAVREDEEQQDALDTETGLMSQIVSSRDAFHHP